MKKQMVMGLLLAACLSATSGLRAGDVPQPSAKLVESGKDLYQQRCVPCHGASGEGNGPAGMYLSPKPRNFKADPFKKGDEPAHVYEAISEGIGSSAMPSFADLSSEERWGLVYYVLSIRGKVDVKTQN